MKTLDKAFEIQADYAKTAYEGLVAQATKMGELYTAMAKDAFKPFEAVIAKAAPAHIVLENPVLVAGFLLFSGKAGAERHRCQTRQQACSRRK